MVTLTLAVFFLSSICVCDSYFFLIFYLSFKVVMAISGSAYVFPCICCGICNTREL